MSDDEDRSGGRENGPASERLPTGGKVSGVRKRSRFTRSALAAEAEAASRAAQPSQAMAPRPAWLDREVQRQRESARRANARAERLRAWQIPDGGAEAEIEKVRSWLLAEGIDEVECLVPDMSGIARGKILPAEKFMRSWSQRALRMPESIFIQTVTGSFPDEDVTSPTDQDVYLHPDPESVRLVPWYDEPTAQVICDVDYVDGRRVEIAPRTVLRRVVDLYHARGWEPVVAPEIEFFLVAVNKDPDYPLQPPIGRSGRPETGRQSFGIDAVNEFDPLFEDIYDWCEDQRIDIDTLAHESGAAQMEMNFNHGAPLALADQTFLFKRTVREAALRHGLYATFMAKPMEDEPGSAMHVHQSVVDMRSGENLFGLPEEGDTPLFLAHIAGLQKYLPFCMPLVAPNVNSYRRLVPNFSAPINLHWGRDNRTVGLRVPLGAADSRRIENRVPGADCNAYLAIAASLACGYLGMVEELEPSRPTTGDAYRLAHRLPRHLSEALAKFSACRPLREVLGEQFIDAVVSVKDAEYEEYQRVISSWERENLLLNV